MDIAPELEELGWCPFATVFDRPCIVCGGTRAVMCLMRADLRGALHFNAVVVLIAVSTLALAVRVAIRDGFSANYRREFARVVSSIPIAVELTLLTAWWGWNIARW